MGRPKLDLPVGVGGKPMARVVAETLLGAPFDLVRVVVAPGAPLDLPVDARLEQVENPGWSEGMASSIRAGLEEPPSEIELAAIALADLPLLRPETLAALFHAWEGHSVPIVYPQYRGRQGHPVFWGAGLFDELRALRGDRGARPVLERHLDVALPVPVDDPGVCLDIDTPDDYARLVGQEPSARAERDAKPSREERSRGGGAHGNE
jgi:molybdenum cofactor cytidylyltransferase